MTISPDAALQTAVYSALTNSAAVAAAFTAYNAGAVRVYDRVPADADSNAAVFPYLTIGEDQIIGQANSCHVLSEAYVKVEVWSRPTRGSKLEVKTIAGAVRDELDRSIPVTGFNVSAFHFHTSIYRREPDGLTERAILEFYYTLEPTA